MPKHSKTDPTDEEISRALDICIEIDVEQIGCDLSIARAMWRVCPALVEAKDFPVEFACNGENYDFDPSEERALAGDFERLRSFLREKHKQGAVSMARAWKHERKGSGGPA